MPNNQKTPKDRIDKKAKDALADLDKVIKAHPDLEPQLKPVKDDLDAIVMDNHKAQ
jgi:hypothetical protein